MGQNFKMHVSYIFRILTTYLDDSQNTRTLSLVYYESYGGSKLKVFENAVFAAFEARD